MFTLKFYDETGAFEVYEAARWRVQPDELGAEKGCKRVEFRDSPSGEVFEKNLCPGGYCTMIAENMNGKTTEIVYGD